MILTDICMYTYGAPVTYTHAHVYIGLEKKKTSFDIQELTWYYQLLDLGVSNTMSWADTHS